ncbi:MAG TPA: serine--tRNA ligase [Planctomycetota bacterium]|nr:serine--tRNA ligase [Planctomycetota bacterium]
MLDPRVIRENPERVKAGARKKRIAADAVVDRFLELDESRRKLAFERDELKARQNRGGKDMARLEGAEREKLRAEMGDVSLRVKACEPQLREIEAEQSDLALKIPNTPDADVPEGETDKDNVEVRRWGEPRRFDFQAKDHIALGTALDLVDFPRAAKIAGTRTYILKNEGALLELGVLQFTLQMLVEKGFVPMIVPTLVKREALVGTAYFPGGEDQAYQCEKDALYLIGTSEVPVTAFHSDEILAEAELPKLYAGISTCYRREAGAAGKDTKGLYRIHQFNKVEQVVICRADEAESREFHDFILKNAEGVLQALGLPYRVVNVCGGDLGAPQVQKFDIETWMPSRGGYGETHSASRFHDFQARRLNLRYRDVKGDTRFCHTLNNTAIASPRILIAILENFQEADGSVRVPEVLRPYLGGKAEIRRKGPSP